MNIKMLLVIVPMLLFFHGSNIFAAALTDSPQSLPLNQLIDSEKYPAVVKNLVNKAYDLERKNLTYLYGSDNPAKGGMDCSGTLSYLLKYFLPYIKLRQADQFYRWVWENGKFYAVNSHDFDSFEFKKLQPGDLLFWSGTYTTLRDPPITHVMMYLGKNNKNQRLMFGASDGRSYKGKKIYGVSVFDFKLPDTSFSSRFIGYSCIPDLTCVKEIASNPS